MLPSAQTTLLKKILTEKSVEETEKKKGFGKLNLLASSYKYITRKWGLYLWMLALPLGKITFWTSSK